MTQNRLASETSPYLRQHADNPVHWQAWGDAAFAEARRSGRPVLLSVGYAACHWCHVMAHESFEDPEIADLMNRLFVNIKVDREERPDLDAIYQHALGVIGQHGGWPLTMFLTPDREPFWGGTYFPPRPAMGRPGFPQVLERLAEIWRDAPEKIRENADGLCRALAGRATARAGGDISVAVTDEVAHRCLEAVDPVNGGIGGAPKFPNIPVQELLWRAGHRTGDPGFAAAVRLTLDRISAGGIHDHLGGGFARYTVDDAWLIPHFEKMLYDNAALLSLLALVWPDRREDIYRDRAAGIVDWLLREMVVADGGFAAALDADSEGEEGRFYVWSAAEIDAALGPDGPAFSAFYDVSEAGNWEGRNILNRLHAPGHGDTETESAWASQRDRLLALREGRVRPGRDDKVLADWNGLMIAALVDADRVFGLPRALDAARRAFAFVVDSMSDGDRLLHAWCDGRAAHPATLDDYAALCRAALALYEATGEAGYLDRLRGWVAVLDRHYLDPHTGAWFTTADDVTDLLTRTLTADDNATPAGAAVLAGTLARLGYLTGEVAWLERSATLCRTWSGDLERNPLALATLLNAAEALRDTVQVVIADTGAPDAAQSLADAARAAAPPDLILRLIDGSHSLPDDHPAAGKTPAPGEDGRLALPRPGLLPAADRPGGAGRRPRGSRPGPGPVTLARLAVDSPLGRLVIGASPDAIVGLDWAEPGDDAPSAARLPLLREAAARLERYFAGQPEPFDLPMDAAGTPFRRAVWAELRRIPRGATRTYGDLARLVDSAPRAVGGACGANPVPIIVPCHRVVGGAGPGGWSGGGGLAAKRFLLALEGATLPL